MLGRVVIAPLRVSRSQPSIFRAFSSSKNHLGPLSTKESTTHVKEYVRSGADGAESKRPVVKGGTISTHVEKPVAQPKTPPGVLKHVKQAPNYPITWSESQRPKSEAMRGPRFEQMDPRYQPNSLSAMQLISEYPIQLTTKRVVACDGGMSAMLHADI